jgi:hypothetical protein
MTRDQLTPDQQQYYDKGVEMTRTGHSTYEGYVKAYGVKPDDTNRAAWYVFNDGANTVHAEVKAAKRIEYRVDEFLAKLNALCAEYDAEISTGCGCCGAGLTVKGDYETGLNGAGSE